MVQGFRMPKVQTQQVPHPGFVLVKGAPTQVMALGRVGSCPGDAQSAQVDTWMACPVLHVSPPPPPLQTEPWESLESTSSAG